MHIAIPTAEATLDKRGDIPVASATKLAASPCSAQVARDSIGDADHVFTRAQGEPGQGE